MAKKNEYIFPKERGWAVKIQKKRPSILFENKKEALEYADIRALNEKRSVINGMVKIEHPIANSFWPLIETRREI